MGIGDFTFFQILFKKIYITPGPSYLLLGFFFYKKLRSLKIPQDLLVLWNFFVPLFNVECI
jgi:hypothetical protein